MRKLMNAPIIFVISSSLILLEARLVSHSYVLHALYSMALQAEELGSQMQEALWSQKLSDFHVCVLLLVVWRCGAEPYFRTQVLKAGTHFTRPGTTSSSRLIQASVSSVWPYATTYCGITSTSLETTRNTMVLIGFLIFIILGTCPDISPPSDRHPETLKYLYRSLYHEC